jgi:hypothetical protein
VVAERLPQRHIDIRPRIGVYRIFRAMHYRPWYAIAEFVDNSLESYLMNKERLRRAEPRYRLRVTVKTEDDAAGHLWVEDNAAGIAEDRYPEAFAAAAERSEKFLEERAKAKGLGRANQGLKAAATWMAANWEVTSAAIGEDFTWTIRFDVPKILREQRESLDPIASRKAKSTHGTTVHMWDLTEQGRGVFQPKTKTALKAYLASMYRRFLRTGELSFIFDRVPLEPPEVDFLEEVAWGRVEGENRAVGSRKVLWRKDVEVQFGHPKRIHTAGGWVGLRASLSRKDNTNNLPLFRLDRLILGPGGTETNRPQALFGGEGSHRYLRMVGEIDIPDETDDSTIPVDQRIDVTPTKDGFTWSEATQNDLYDQLRKAAEAPPPDVIKQASSFRTKKNERISARVEEKVFDRVTEAIPHLATAIEEKVGEPETTAPSALPKVKITQSRTYELRVRGERWLVTLDLTNDSEHESWIDFAHSESGPPGAYQGSGTKRAPRARQLGLRVFTGHPFMHTWARDAASLEALLRLAVGIGLAVTTAKISGVKGAETVLTDLNRFLAELARSDQADSADEEDE